MVILFVAGLKGTVLSMTRPVIIAAKINLNFGIVNNKNKKHYIKLETLGEYILEITEN